MNTKAKVFDTMKAAAAGLGLNIAVVKRAKAAGCQAFRGSRVYGAELQAFVASHPELMKAQPTGDIKLQKLREEHRKLKLANDVKEGVLVSRAWIAERMRNAAGRYNTFRARAEAEYPMRFDAIPKGDLSGQRVVVCEMFDEVGRLLVSLQDCFSEKKAKR